MAMIQWFPGHMAKALRQIKEQLPLIDIVYELVDARVPYSSQNPEIKRLAGSKPRLLIMTKADLADPDRLNQWRNFFQQRGQHVVAVDSRANQVKKTIIAETKEILAAKLAADQAKGLQKKAVRAMCVGVPNVGKSTLLNHLVKKNVASTGNRPGVTTGQQWLRMSKEVELLDTPGVLWPKFQSAKQGQMLALTGAIKDTIYAPDDVALLAIDYLRKQQPERLAKRYRLSNAEMGPAVANPDLLLTITQKLGMKDDYDRASRRIIIDLRKGKLGKVTLEVPSDLNEDGINE